MDWTFDYICKPMGGLTEGPVWDGEVLRFTQIHSSRVLEFDPLEGEISEWGSDTNRTNGLAYDVSGQMFGCSSGGRAILRFDADGTNTVIADKFEEKLLNTPNDLAIDANGRIWFSNPWNAGNVDVEPSQQLDHRSVMRLEPKADGGYTLHRATIPTCRTGFYFRLIKKRSMWRNPILSLAIFAICELIQLTTTDHLARLSCCMSLAKMKAAYTVVLMVCAWMSTAISSLARAIIAMVPAP
jgi:hypothetical protein